MRILIAALVLLALSLAATAHADSVSLRDHVQVTGGAITIGDVFENAGPLAARVIAPAPAPGQSATLAPAVLAAAASASGLDWTPPANFTGVTITRGTDPHSSGIRATLPNRNAADQAQLINASAPAISSGPVANAAVHRGESVMLTYSVPGVQLSARARALEDGAVGQDIRLVNLSSNRTIDATVTGPGAAIAAPMQ
jgi:flagella basal body P-ring formation protein FlgA